MRASESVAAKHAEDHHQTRPQETRYAETPMNIQAAGGDEGSLRDQQQDPAGEGGSMQVDDETGQRSAEHSGEIISACKAQEDGGQHQQRHRGEKEVVETTAWHGRCGPYGNFRTYRDCGHRYPVALGFVGRFLGPWGSGQHCMLNWRESQM